MAELNKFRCPDGHNFEAKRSFRAFCSQCGKSARRVYEGDETTPNNNANDSEAGKGADDTENPGSSSGPSDSPPQDDSKPERKFKARRVVVRRGTKPTPNNSDRSRKTPKTREAVSKTKIISRRRSEAGPSVTKRVVTNKDKANDAKAKGAGEFSTTWQRIKKISGF